jgi:hypothetical protein
MSLLMLFSAFTVSWPATLVADDSSSSNDSQEASADNLFKSTLAEDNDGDILIDSEPDSKARTTRLRTTATETLITFFYEILINFNPPPA